MRETEDEITDRVRKHLAWAARELIENSSSTQPECSVHGKSSNTFCEECRISESEFSKLLWFLSSVEKTGEDYGIASDMVQNYPELCHYFQSVQE